MDTAACYKVSMLHVRYTTERDRDGETQVWMRQQQQQQELAVKSACQQH